MDHDRARVEVARSEAGGRRFLPLGPAGDDRAQLGYAEHLRNGLGRELLLLAHDQHDRVDIRAPLERQEAPGHDGLVDEA